MGKSQRILGCISIKELKAFKAGELTPERKKEIRSHLAICQECSEEYVNVAFLFPALENYLQNLRKAGPIGPHVSDATYKKLLSGNLTDESEQNVVFGHFLSCKECNNKFVGRIKKFVTGNLAP
ncbi:MAG: zf-HC2 domain-containing protein [Candidatus Azambacteria bacterium]|nr:zf-HC2 domain-containing protein [Candidatus Azambacteria bacterium]